jgi:hypothetical protein
MKHTWQVPVRFKVEAETAEEAEEIVAKHVAKQWRDVNTSVSGFECHQEPSIFVEDILTHEEFMAQLESIGDDPEEENNNE